MERVQGVITQYVSHTPEIKIADHTLEVVDKFTYLGSTISMNLSFDSEISQRIGKATGVMFNLTKKAWKKNTRLKAPKCTSTKHPFSAHCFAAVKLGPPA